MDVGARVAPSNREEGRETLRTLIKTPPNRTRLRHPAAGKRGSPPTQIGPPDLVRRQGCALPGSPQHPIKTFQIRSRGVQFCQEIL